MNNFYISLLFSFIAGISTILGFFAIYVKPKNVKSFLSFILSFSLAIMLFISLFDLIPEALKSLRVSTSISGIIIFLIMFLAASKLFNLIDRAIDSKNEDDLYKIGLLSAVALFLHNLPEGILTFSSTYEDFNLGLKVVFLIAMHNIPEGISIAIPVYFATKKKGRALFLTVVSGLSEPIAGIITFIFFRHFLNINLISMMMLFAASIMIFLSVFKLYPQINSYNKKNAKHLGFIIGASISLLVICL